MNQVRRDIETFGLIEKGWGVVVGVSGGADSVCLLYVLKMLQKDMELKLTAVHVHHGLRGKEADDDAALVDALCTSLEIPLEIHYTDIRSLASNRGLSLEEAGREERYRILTQVLEKTGAQVIAVAHQKEDQAETVMLHLLRGTGLDGLCGMEMRQGAVIRPLIHVSRSEILCFLKEQKIDYRVDSSNLSNDYTRNRIRNELFPLMREMFLIDPNEQLVRLSKLVRDDRSFLDQSAKAAMEGCLIEDKGENGKEPCVVLSIERMKTFPDALIKRIIRLAWERINNNRKNLEWVHVCHIMELIDKGKTGKRLDLPRGIIAKVSYGRLIFLKEAEEGTTQRQGFYSYPVVPESVTYAKEARGALKGMVLPAREAFLRYGRPDTMNERHLVQLFDYDRLISGITLRNRRDGDRIHLRGVMGDKKLKEYFIDAKIPREQRDDIPLVASGNKIIWVIGMRTSQYYRANEETQRVWVLTWDND